MGEANILCAKGEYDKAKGICIYIIKQVPKCPEPFQTLGMVYEMQGHMEKALQFFLITAYLSKSQDVEEWLKLAGMSLEQNDYKQAMVCYNKALKCEPENISVLWDRAALNYQMKDHKKATEGYETILKLLPLDSPDKFFDLSIEISMIYHEDASIDKAIEVMNATFEKYPNHLDYRAINLLAELNMTSKQYSVALKNICTLCNFTQQSTDDESSSEEPLSSFSKMLGFDIQHSPQKTKFLAPKSTIPSLISRDKWIIPEAVPIDIRVKAVVCLIYIHQLHPVKTLMSSLFKENIEEVGDLYLDIAEAYADTGEHIEALPILDTLVLSPKYNQVTNKHIVAVPILDTLVLSPKYNQVTNKHIVAVPILDTLVLSPKYNQVTNKHIVAVPILDTLVLSPKYNQAAVWLKKAQCLMSLGRLEEAIMAYNQVVTLAPNHLEAKITLSSLHQQLGQPDQALDILTERSNDHGLFTPITSEATSSGKSDDPMDVDQPKDDLKPQDYRLMFHKCVLLESQNRTMDFVDAGLQLFSMYFHDVYYNIPDENEISFRLKFRFNDAFLVLCFIRANGTLFCKIKCVSGVPSSRSKDDTGIRVEEWWDMLKKVIVQASSIKRHHDAEHLVLCGLNSSRLTNCKEYQHELEFMSVLASCLNKKYKLAFDYVRNVMNTQMAKQMMWNILSAVVCKTEDLRHHRYCMRLLTKHPDNVSLLILNGHNAFVAGSYKFAVGKDAGNGCYYSEYINAFRQNPEDPMISLCLGVQYIHLACQKFPRGRHMIVVQGILFLFQYLALRGECQEVYYNIGRAFHQLGLPHFAVHYYKKVLEFPYHLASTDKTWHYK
ncbi:hypothetical protein QZH41_015788, partial [Actinostola sp. cb2023]